MTTTDLTNAKNENIHFRLSAREKEIIEKAKKDAKDIHANTQEE
jgi:hypothetical protein